MAEELLHLLRQFIAFRSMEGNSGAKIECLDWIEATFLRNCTLKRERGDVHGAPYLFLGHGDPALLLFAHIDVVPATEAMFSLLVEGDRASGRGVKDMKGGILPYLLAYRDALTAKTFPRLSLLFTSDEEVGGRSIPSLIETGIIAAPIAYTPDTGNNPMIVTEHKGAVWAELRSEGRGSHGAWPWEGENPVTVLAEAICSIAKAFPSGVKEEWRLTVSPTVIRGSDAKNKIPDSAAATLDIRYPTEICRNADEALALVAKAIPSKCSLRPLVTAGALRTDPKHPMVQQFKRCSEEILGHPVEIGREHGASDARFFQEFGIPAFLFGPEGGGLHASDEWVSVRSLEDHYKIARKVFEELQ